MRIEFDDVAPISSNVKKRAVSSTHGALRNRKYSISRIANVSFAKTRTDCNLNATHSIGRLCYVATPIYEPLSEVVESDESVVIP